MTLREPVGMRISRWAGRGHSQVPGATESGRDLAAGRGRGHRPREAAWFAETAAAGMDSLVSWRVAQVA